MGFKCVRTLAVTVVVVITGLFTLSGCQTIDRLTYTDHTAAANHPVPMEVATIATVEEIFAAITTDPVQAEAEVQIAEAQIAEAQIAEPLVFTDIWMRMQSQLSLPVPQNRKVIAQRNWYAKHQSYLDRISDRATPFLYFIVAEIQKRNMPIELALLPIVESAFDPFAYSHGSASGMWQFIPGTAKRFGLKHNWWYDGRRDVIGSTRAALDYLAFLHKTFNGDWLHAIAAYNSGEGRVSRAIKRNKRKKLPTDFWSLKLPRETAAYVPKLLALADLLKRPQAFNLVWKPIENTPQIAVIDAKSQMDIALAAQMADIPVGELHGLNPGYSQWATAPKGPHTFIVPIKKASAFEQKLAASKPQDRLKWKRYKIKSGDSLITIARKFNTTADIIQAVNNIKGNMIRQGKHLLIPVAAQDLDQYQLSQDQRLATRQATKAGSAKIDYLVKKGDTLWDISRAYKVNIRSLAKWNNMAPRDRIHPGQSLAIWKKAGNMSTAVAKKGNAIPSKSAIRTINYKVRNGDSLARIAGKFSILIKDIVKWNQLNRKNYLQPGQRLKLFVDVTKV